MQGNKPRVAGAIFQNNSGRGPAFTGVVEIDGVKTQIALWPKTSAAGKDYLQISEDRKKATSTTPQPPRGYGQRSPTDPVNRRDPARSMTSRNSDMDDDIPF